MSVLVRLAFDEAKHPRDVAGRWSRVLDHLDDAARRLGVGNTYGAVESLKRARRAAPAGHAIQTDIQVAESHARSGHLEHGARVIGDAAVRARGNLPTRDSKAYAAPTVAKDLRVRLRKRDATPGPAPVPAGVSTSLHTVTRHVTGAPVQHQAFAENGGRVGIVHEDGPREFTIRLPGPAGGVEQRTFKTLTEALAALEQWNNPRPARPRIRRTTAL